MMFNEKEGRKAFFFFMPYMTKCQFPVFGIIIAVNGLSFCGHQAEKKKINNNN